MRLTGAIPLIRMLRAARVRLAAEHGFTMIVALGVLAVTSLLTSAVFIALDSDVHQSARDLAAKRAYYAARAGLDRYLYYLNQQSNYWATCANDVQATTAVPGSTASEQYSYAPVYANGSTSCGSDVVSSLIDRSSGTLRMAFTGSAAYGPSSSQVVQRGLVASFRMTTPLDFLWYTHFEALDSSITGYSDCGMFYRDNRNSHCNIQWITGDTVKGPMYTDDQYYVPSGQSPTFGRNSNDQIQSTVPSTSAAAICAGSNCNGANIKGQAIPNAKPVPIPQYNNQLLTYAQQFGQVFQGTTTIILNGTSATATQCQGTTASQPQCAAPQTFDLTQDPIIYVKNACTPGGYSPFGATYPSTSAGNYYGCAGDVYVSGSYTAPVTIAAANNIVINGSLTTSEDSTTNLPTGQATLGLVANQFVRVMHGVSGTCAANGGGTNISSQTLTNLKIDAAIVTLAHSFIVDNYSCGAQLGNLTVNGAIAQYFRGTVGTSGQQSTGYIKKYSYDDRLQDLLPPYMFNLSNSGWRIIRQTLCVPAGSVAGTRCT